MKCQFCSSKLEDGEAPACASVCPTDALMFGTREEMLAKAHEIINNDSRYLNHVYGEKEVGGTSWLYISDVDFGELGFPTNLPEKSIPENVHGFTRFTIPIFAVGAAAWTGVSLYAKRRHAVAHEGHHAEEHHEEA
jgi:formate dehydrogenase iron-sulfur subunit